MSTDNNSKRPARLGRGLTSLMGGPVEATAPAPPAPENPPRARLATAPPAELLADGAPSKPVSAPAHSQAAADASPSSPSQAVIEIPVARIEPNPYQPRKHFELKALEQLAASIRIDGVMQPILVRRRRDDQYELIAGERRWRAAQLAELATIPAIVRTLSDRETAEWALVENLQREDLNPIERGEAFQQLVERYQLSHEQVADRVGVERSTITNALRLLALHADVQQFVRDGLLSAGQAKVLAGVTDLDAQRMLAVRAVRDASSVRQLEQAVRDAERAATGDASGSKRTRSPHTADLERQITEQLGTKVRLQQSRKKGAGTLAIEFYSLEQFDGLLTKLGVKVEEA